MIQLEKNSKNNEANNKFYKERRKKQQKKGQLPLVSISYVKKENASRSGKGCF